jgi:hypothetical protein
MPMMGACPSTTMRWRIKSALGPLAEKTGYFREVCGCTGGTRTCDRHKNGPLMQGEAYFQNSYFLVNTIEMMHFFVFRKTLSSPHRMRPDLCNTLLEEADRVEVPIA